MPSSGAADRAIHAGSGGAVAPDGTYAPCTPCPAGTYSNAANAQACTNCTAGSVTGASGLSECTPCDVAAECPAGAVAPTADDIEAIAPYDGDPVMLAKVERFFFAVHDVPLYTRRVLALQKKRTFASQAVHVSTLLETVTTACAQLVALANGSRDARVFVMEPGRVAREDVRIEPAAAEKR